MTGTDENGRPRGRVVTVDQVGYPPNAAKLAVVTADATAFEVVRLDDGATVYAGELSAPVDAPAAGERVRHAEFSAVTAPGEYALVADGGAGSHPFRVAADVYEPVLAAVGRLYGLKRSNTAIDDPVTGLDAGPGHAQDAEARLYFADEFRDAGDRLDVAGGWYDAGDYGKYVPPAAITVAQQLLAYELYPDAFAPGSFDLPSEASQGAREAGLPDVLREAKFELAWLMRMQRPDGAVYHKVAGEAWPPLDRRPEDDTQERYVFGLSTFGTALFAGAMAVAARVYEGRDPAFAARALERARDAQAFLEATPEPLFRFDEGQDAGSGPYRKEGDAGERFWAAAELLRTTGERRYADHLESRLADRFGAGVTPPSWADALALGQWAYRSADAGDPDRRAAIEAAFLDRADDLVRSIEADGYRVALASDEYRWASAKLTLAKGTLLLLADEIDPDDAYVAGALDQLHYALGRTPTGYSYVTGVGSRPSEHPHDRLVESTGVDLPGMLVGGPNADGDDDALAAFVESESPPPAKAYVDDAASYAGNEWAIDYSAPLVVLLARFVARPP